ncbi:MAG: hypothetical protein HYX89_01445 [Chloroflexi bacterium]|nr:hypothetical protein [Chloroflexota bacterium]
MARAAGAIGKGLALGLVVGAVAGIALRSPGLRKQLPLAATFNLGRVAADASADARRLVRQYGPLILDAGIFALELRRPFLGRLARELVNWAARPPTGQ